MYDQSVAALDFRHFPVTANGNQFPLETIVLPLKAMHSLKWNFDLECFFETDIRFDFKPSFLEDSLMDDLVSFSAYVGALMVTGYFFTNQKDPQGPYM